MSTGLVRKPKAPLWVACTASGMVPCAVRMMTLQARPAALQLLEQSDAVHLVHAQVGDHEVGPEAACRPRAPPRRFPPPRLHSSRRADGWSGGAAAPGRRRPPGCVPCVSEVRRRRGSRAAGRMTGVWLLRSSGRSRASLRLGQLGRRGRCRAPRSLMDCSMCVTASSFARASSSALRNFAFSSDSAARRRLSACSLSCESCDASSRNRWFSACRTSRWSTSCSSYLGQQAFDREQSFRPAPAIPTTVAARRRDRSRCGPACARARA